MKDLLTTFVEDCLQILRERKARERAEETERKLLRATLRV